MAKAACRQKNVAEDLLLKLWPLFTSFVLSTAQSTACCWQHVVA